MKKVSVFLQTLNLIDIFILTKDYDENFRSWLDGTITDEPLAPSTDFLYNMLAEELNKIKKNAGITSPTKPGAATV